MTPMRYLPLALALAIAPFAANATGNPVPFSVTLGVGALNSDADPLKGVSIPMPAPYAEVDHDNDDTVFNGALTWHLDDHWAIEGWLSQGASHRSEIDVEYGPDQALAHYDTRTMALMAQYHFAPIAKRFKPFIGAGWQWTSVKDLATSAVPSLAGLQIGDANGYALAAGVDIVLDDSWFVRADVRHFDGEARVTGQEIARRDTSMDALYYGASIGFRF